MKEETIKSKTFCPTCGSECKVVSSDEGTHHYTPVSKEERRQKLFNHFAADHDIMLMEDDFRAIEEAFNPTVYPYTQ